MLFEELGQGLNKLYYNLIIQVVTRYKQLQFIFLDAVLDRERLFCQWPWVIYFLVFSMALDDGILSSLFLVVFTEVPQPANSVTP